MMDLLRYALIATEWTLFLGFMWVWIGHG